MKDMNSLAHTTWNCKYHIVFAPKYRRQIIRDLCERKGVVIHEANACPDHIHMLVSIPPKLSVSQFMGYLKGKSSLMIFDRHANLKYRYGNRKFWCRGFYVDTVGRNKKKIQQYIREQLVEDHRGDQLSLFEDYDPFTGEKRNSLEWVSGCGAKGKPIQWAFKTETGKEGFKPQSKPLVHTGGFDLYNKKGD